MIVLAAIDITIGLERSVCACEVSSGGSRISPRWGRQHDFGKISQKLHEIERIWTPGGAPPLDTPLVLEVSFVVQILGRGRRRSQRA